MTILKSFRVSIFRIAIISFFSFQWQPRRKEGGETAETTLQAVSRVTISN